MLGFRRDTGCSGLLEPEVAIRIMEAIMVEGSFWMYLFMFCCESVLESSHSSLRDVSCTFFLCACDLSSKPRFRSDPNDPGVEKVNATRIPDEFLDGPYERLPSTFGGPVAESYMFFSDSERSTIIISRRCFQILIIVWYGAVFI